MSVPIRYLFQYHGVNYKYLETMKLWEVNDRCIFPITRLTLVEELEETNKCLYLEQSALDNKPLY